METFIFRFRGKIKIYLCCQLLSSSSFKLALKNLTKQLNQNIHKKIILQNIEKLTYKLLLRK